MLGDMAEALDVQLGKPAEALDALIKAIGAVPARLDLHDRARELAKRIGSTRSFVESVEGVVDRLRRKDDPPLIANILMRAGDALETDANDLRGAANLYRRVEILGEKLAEAFYAQARVAAALGDTAEQARTLDKMFELAGTDAEPTPQQVDALYRLAEIFIGSDTRRQQGIELLERAFGAEPRWAQAGRLLKTAAAASPNDEKIFTMYERVARNGGDQELLLDFLERRAGVAGATPKEIREAVDLAVELAHEERAEALLVRAVAAARETADGLGSAPWATCSHSPSAGSPPTICSKRATSRTRSRRSRIPNRSMACRCGSRRAPSLIARSISRPRSTSSCASAAPPTAPCGSRCSRSTASSATVIASAAWCHRRCLH